MSLSTDILVRHWNAFWFSPINSRGVAIVRIGLGLMLLVNLFEIWPHADLLFGAEEGPGAVSVESARRYLPRARWTPLDTWNTPLAVQGLMVCALVAHLSFTVGFRSRTMGIVSVLAAAAMYQRNPWFMNGGDRVLRLAVLYLSLVPCGAAFSVDAWRQKSARCPTVPILGFRLIQIQLAGMYLVSGLQKVQSSQWLDGSALYYAMSTGNFQRWPELMNPLLGTLPMQWFCQLGTWVTLGWELSFALLVLWAPTRRIALWVGLLFHAGIWATMTVGAFSYVTPWCYLAFLKHEDWNDVLDRWKLWRGLQ